MLTKQDWLNLAAHLSDIEMIIGKIKHRRTAMLCLGAVYTFVVLLKDAVGPIETKETHKKNVRRKNHR